GPTPRVDETAMPEFSWVGETARRVGTVVHGWLQRIADDALQGWTSARARALAAGSASARAKRIPHHRDRRRRAAHARGRPPFRRRRGARVDRRLQDQPARGRGARELPRPRAVALSRAARALRKRRAAGAECKARTLLPAAARLARVGDRHGGNADMTVAVEAGARVRLEVNGKRCESAAAADTPLIYVLRNDLGLKGT